MSFFKKLGKNISSTFKKAPSVISSIFKKGSGIANDISGGLGQVGNVLGKIASVGSSILNNPIAEGAASMILGPEAGAAMKLAGTGINLAQRASNIAKTGSSLAGRASQITNPSQYKSASDVMGGIQKAKALGHDISNGVSGPSFV